MSEASQSRLLTFNTSPWTMPAPSLLRLPPQKLVTKRRLDVAVKWRFFNQLLLGGDDDAERVYRWHIEVRSGARLDAGLATDKWKLTIDDYVRSASDLIDSMAKDGFLASGAIPVDPDGELLDGSHRLACALALHVPMVSVMRLSRKAWAPPWDLAWFIEHGMAQDVIRRTTNDWIVMKL